MPIDIKKSISIIETYSIDNIDSLVHQLANVVSYLTIVLFTEVAVKS